MPGPKGSEAEQEADAVARQAEAIAAGRQALAEGQPVIWVHGRPYADPDGPSDPEEGAESPFPWDLWDGERPE
jgi:hypothetical protein